MKERRKLLVVDLDGTLIRGNTLHIFFRCALRQMLRRGRIWTLVNCLALLALRKAGTVSHVAMKFGIWRRIELTDALLRDFQDAARPLLRADVAALVAEYRSRGYGVLLATAAPADYVPCLWDGPYVATDMSTRSNPERLECRGREKLRHVREYADANGFVSAAAVSDDLADDAPLLSAVDEAWSAAGTLRRIRTARQTSRI